MLLIMKKYCPEDLTSLDSTKKATVSKYSQSKIDPKLNN